MDGDRAQPGAETESCPHCGQQLAAGHPPVASLSEGDSPVFPDVVVQHASPAVEVHDFTFDADFVTVMDDAETSDESVRLRWVRLAAAAVAAVAIGIGAVVWATRTSPEAAIEASESSGADTSATDPETDTQGAGDTQTDETQTDEIVANGSELIPASEVDISAWFAQQVGALSVATGRDYSVVYPSVDGLRVLDTEGLSVTATRDALRFDEAIGLRLFTDGDKTWGVAPDDPSESYIVSRNYAVVDMGFDGAVAFVNSDGDGTTVGISSFGGWGGGVELPPGTETLPAQGLGLLVLPETGGTLILTGPGLRPFSDHRVVAGVGGTIITQRCDERLDCGIYLQTDTDTERANSTPAVQLPAAVGEALYPSGNGTWVLAIDADGSARIIEAAAATAWDIGTIDTEAIAWSPDGAFVSWLSGSELHLAVPEYRTQSSATLPVAPSASTLIVTG